MRKHFVIVMAIFLKSKKGKLIQIFSSGLQMLKLYRKQCYTFFAVNFISLGFRLLIR